MRRLPFDYAVRNLGRSPLRFALAFTGAFMVAALATAATALLWGMDHALGAGRERDHAIVMGVGSEESLERSEIPAGTASILVASVPGIPTAAGQPLVSPEAVMMLPMSVGNAELSRPALVRGVEPVALLVHPGVRIVKGRMPEAGASGRGDEMISEAMVGIRAEQQLGLPAGSLEVGRRFTIDRTTFEVTGRFEAPGTMTESEVWAPLSDVLAASKRTTISCLVVALDSEHGAMFEDIDAFTARRLDLELVVLRESEYYAALRTMFAPIRWMIAASAFMVAFGALLGGLNTLHAAFASRAREVGTLRSIGFGRVAIILSFTQESLLLSAAAATCAIIACRWLLDGVGIGFSMGSFVFRVDMLAVAIGLAAGLALALLGAAVAASATLRRTIPEALRAP
ncbi:MAG: ABC transporter permease [Phycisphaeraceae bacterium]|nr:ABC transporter permease [Phycisphaeraceae bacterium]